MSWSSKKQNCVALSTAEAEYVAADACCAQLLWMRQTLQDFGCHFTKIPLLCDNKSVIKLANNPVSHSRTKHIDIWHHFLRDHKTKGDIKIHHVSTTKQLANIFTKPFDESRFYALRSELNILDSRNVVWTIAHLDWWTSMDRRNELERFKYYASKWFIIRNKCIMIIVCIDYLLLIIVCLRYVSISYMYISI